MPLNIDALKDSVNGHKPKAKRPNPGLSRDTGKKVQVQISPALHLTTEQLLD